MSVSKDAVLENLEQSLAAWRRALERYSFKQLLHQPSPAGWCLGQVYMHIISESDHFLKEAELCLVTVEYIDEAMSAEGKAMFEIDSFPEIRITGPDSNLNTPLPVSKQYLADALLQISKNAKLLGSSKTGNWMAGKSRHPGLGYFNALEWVQFAGMHVRHHMRQKARIDVILSRAT